MREIKFRAWLTKEGKFVENYISRRDTNDGQLSVPNIFPQCLEEGECVIPLQFTGLQDKNNKDIYEGDIVKTLICLGPAGEDYFNVPVKYGELGEISIQLWPYNEKKKFWPEIIGNIYENPELLEKK
jgi:uncharacterized phage protein (TIGR01671 family)